MDIQEFYKLNENLKHIVKIRQTRTDFDRKAKQMFIDFGSVIPPPTNWDKEEQEYQANIDRIDIEEAISRVRMDFGLD